MAALSAILFYAAMAPLSGPPAPVSEVEAVSAAPQADTGAAAADSVIIVTAAPKSDPLEKVNVETYKVTQSVDNAVIGPAARVYRQRVPKPVQDGLRNFFRNLREPVVAVNDLLQLHPGRSVRTLARFAVNSTAGGAGLVDIAKRKPFKLPRHPNSLADTLGYYGVKPGPYLYLPLIGPTTVRDLLAGGLDRLAVPFSIGGPFKQPAYTISAGAVGRLDRRARADGRLNAIREDDDPYAARRAAYLHDRQAEIDALHIKGNEASAAAFAELDPIVPLH